MKLDSDDFELFGLPRRFALNRSDIDARWKALQGEVHPDRYAAEGPTAQRLAMQWAVRVNEAYARLRDPLKRAAYLCELRGAAIDAENNTAMPAAFLLQQMAWRERLDDAASVADASKLEAEVTHAEQVLLREIQQLLDQHGDAQTAAERVRALMFVARFRADIDRRLEALGQ
jgi:molecular chaperone HscB